MLPPSGNPFKCHEEFLYLQPSRSHLLNVLTFFHLTGGYSEGLDAFRFFRRNTSIQKEKSHDVLSIRRENDNEAKRNNV